jgi:23S rRNA (pseudouridine1915-N3)-methyltransferase
VRLILVCVGRGGKTAEQALCDSYLQRAQGLGPRLGFSKIDLKAVDTSRAATLSGRLSEEAERLTQHVPAGAHRIVLDEAGRSLTSEAFAAHLGALRDRSVRDVAFVIGGPDGLAPNLLSSAQERLAFGTQTWPHLLVRAMLAEQLYRSFSILAGHPYHRGRPGS